MACKTCVLRRLRCSRSQSRYDDPRASAPGAYITRGLCLRSRRRAIKIYAYRNANSNVNQEAAKLLISRGNFLRTATRRGETRCNRQERCDVRLFACVQTGLLPTVFRPMIYARGRSCRTLMSLGPGTGRAASPPRATNGTRDWKIMGFSALAVDAARPMRTE